MDRQPDTKALYEAIAVLFEEKTGVRAFVPHEHYDPTLHAHFTPAQVDAAERDQVCHHTSLLVVVAVAPSWGGGIEVEMAFRSGIPVIILCPAQKKISRLLRGNPAVTEVVYFTSRDDMLAKLWPAVASTYPLAHA